MTLDRKHIIFKVLAIGLILTLMFPITYKFTHIFEHHKHEVCIGTSSTHVHKVDLDCEFQKFQFNNQFFSNLKNEVLLSVLSKYELPVLTYKFLNNHRPLSFSLRGPPVLV
jgi:ABC-type maltose transport system permease subunit